jgi:hypothetical protein
MIDNFVDNTDRLGDDDDDDDEQLSKMIL